MKDIMTKDQIIKEKLKEIEAERNITILWAVESGSRSWNLASKDSDYDIRFVYKRPLDDYINLNPPADVQETITYMRKNLIDFLPLEIDLEITEMINEKKSKLEKTKVIREPAKINNFIESFLKTEPDKMKLNKSYGTIQVLNTELRRTVHEN